MMTEICSLDSDKFESLYRIIAIFEKSEAVIITDSIIRQQFNTATIISNVSEIVGEKFNLQILNPKKYIKLLKTLIGKKVKKITIHEDYERYIISNGEVNVYCPKQIEKIRLNNSVSSISGDISGIGDDIKIDKDSRKVIKQLAADTDFIDLLVHKNQIKAVSIPETAIFKFDNYVEEDINEFNCDFRLRTYTLFEIDGESYTISLGIDKSDTYWVQSKVDTGLISVNILESAIRRDDNENMLI